MSTPASGASDPRIPLGFGPPKSMCTSQLTEWFAKQKSPNFVFTTKMVFPKSLVFMNSGSQTKGKYMILPRAEPAKFPLDLHVRFPPVANGKTWSSAQDMSAFPPPQQQKHRDPLGVVRKRLAANLPKVGASSCQRPPQNGIAFFSPFKTTKKGGTLKRRNHPPKCRLRLQPKRFTK